MARLLTCGYETGDVSEAGTSTVGVNAALTVVTSTPTPRSGSYCLKCSTTVTGWNNVYKSFTLPASKTDVWIRFAFFSHALTQTEDTIGIVLDSAGSPHVAMTYQPANGLLRLYRGGTGGTLIATSSSGFSQDGWHVIEWRHQMTSTTVGISEVWIDSTQVINFSGDNAATATVNVLTVQLGHLNGNANTTGTYLAFDDIAINDTAGSVNNARCGDGKIVLLVPTGAGSSTVLTRGGTDTGANWSQTSELPPSMTQYVLSATAADRDLYAMSNLGVAVSSIKVVEEVVLGQNSDAGAGSIGLTIKSGGTTNEATAQAFATTAAYKVARWETDPNTSAAWTSTAVDAVEAGVTVR